MNQRIGRSIAFLGTKGNSRDVQSKIVKDIKDARTLCGDSLRLIQELPRQGVNKTMIIKLSKALEGEMKTVDAYRNEMTKKMGGAVAVDSSDGSAFRAEGEPRYAGAGMDTPRGSFGGVGSHAPGMGNSSSSRSGYGDDRYGGGANQEQDDMSMFIAIDDHEALMRSQNIQQIERDMTDVAEMFKDLKTLVDEQQEDIDSISDNIAKTKEQTIHANESLLKAEGYQNKARKKQCCILFIVLALLAIAVLGIYFVMK